MSFVLIINIGGPITHLIIGLRITRPGNSNGLSFNIRRVKPYVTIIRSKISSFRLPIINNKGEKR